MFASLQKVTATGPGATLDCLSTAAKFALQTVIIGGPSAITINLMGSLDGLNFAQIGTTTNVAGDLVFVVDKPVQFVRADLATLTGGTSPKVTAYIACTY